MRIAVIGAGMSGLAAASVLKQRGHNVTVLEKHDACGGVWTVTYPGVNLQSPSSNYHFSDFPWPFKPDFHATGAQVLQYVEQAVEHFKLDVRVRHEVVRVSESGDLWNVVCDTPHGERAEVYDFVIICTGQFTEGKYRPEVRKGRFRGPIITDREIDTVPLSNIETGKVVVVGYGKTALDIAMLKARKGHEVSLLFRKARWILPRYIGGISYSHILFTRLSSALVPVWDFPTGWTRVLHTNFTFIVSAFWKLVSVLFAIHTFERFGIFNTTAAKERLRLLRPSHNIVRDLRSSLPLAPDNFFEMVAKGDIVPVQGEILKMTPTSAQLHDGRRLCCDAVILCTGNTSPSFPFLPERYRNILERDDDGVQLYRHMFHPDLPRIAFGGFNHCFLHAVSSEVSGLYMSAVISGEVSLPPREKMMEAIAYMQNWKRSEVEYYPGRCVGVDVRFQHYIDALMVDLQLSPYRKMPNVLAEMFCQYGPEDYVGLVEEFEKCQRSRRHKPLIPSSSYF